MSLERHPDVRYEQAERVHRGRIFDLTRLVVRLPSGRAQRLELIEHCGAVAVIARDPAGRLLVVRQFRAAAGDWLEEIPAGRREPGEDPLTTARRELEEETGYRARRWTHLRTFLPAPGFVTERIHLFEAEDLQPVEGERLPTDPDEELEVLWRTPEELLGCPTTDAKTLIAALLAR
jgi:ADP-ribose pyrophosphatase